VAALLRAGADVTVVDRDGMTPLHLAAHSGNAAQVAALLRAGAAVDAVCHGNGRQPLHYAAFCTARQPGKAAAVAALLRAGAAVGALDHDGSQPLHLAAFAGGLEAVRLLIRAGAPLGARDNRGHVPRWYAMKRAAHSDQLNPAIPDPDCHDFFGISHALSDAAAPLE